jgi:hypothetical protein
MKKELEYLIGVAEIDLNDSKKPAMEICDKLILDIADLMLRKEVLTCIAANFHWLSCDRTDCRMIAKKIIDDLTDILYRDEE